MFDRYDRLLAYVRLPSGRQLNRAQVAAGWAKVLVVGRRFLQYSEYKRYARRAKREGFGHAVKQPGEKHPSRCAYHSATY